MVKNLQEKKVAKDEGAVPLLVNWKFGEGHEGVFVQPTMSSDRVLLVGIGIPWWGMVIARLELKVHSILLRDYRFFDLVKAYFGSEIPLGKMVNQSREDILLTREALRSCAVIALENLPRADHVLSEMWMMSRVRLILVSHGRLIPPPHGWNLSRRKISHARVGGVTDVVEHLGVYFRCAHVNVTKVLSSWNKGTVRPRRDLRSVLKMAVGGSRCGPPKAEGPSSLSTGQVTKEIRTGVVLNCGLLGVKTNGETLRLPRVKTPFGGNLWVIRTLTPAEVLACWDVPEKLGLLAKTDHGKRQIMNAMFTPIKIRQALLEDIRPVMHQLIASEGRNISGETCEPPSLMNRGPSLILTTPEEERKIFQDKSEPPVNLLIKSLEDLKLTGVGKCVVDPGNPSIATKDDKSPVKSEWWDKYLFLGLSEYARAGPWARAARTIRPLIARHWRRLQLRKWIRYVRNKQKGLETVSDLDRDAARECLIRLQATTFWEWKSGSRPMFWNFKESQQITMRDGIVLWMKGRMDPWLVPQRLPRNPADIPKVIEKLCMAREKGYIDIGVVHSLISFFEVPKGLTDIRMVYDGTKSGLNDMLWAPWFPLPTVDSLLRSVEPGTWMADNDVGEMFLNFVLHESIQALCGVDLTKYFPEGVPDDTKVLWERWTRCAMGLRPSPYQACQGMMWALEIIFGDRKDARNVFRYDRIRLNLPGHFDYDPAKPWVYKQKVDGKIACDVHVYVDDLRTTGTTEEECWMASQRVSSVLASLGIQDAARKRRLPRQDAGAWKGSVVNTSNKMVTVLATREKWAKLKTILLWLFENLEDPDGMDHKELERKRGFLVHMVQTYPALNPYLKGVHGTLDSWRSNRDVNGFRVKIEKKRPRTATESEGGNSRKKARFGNDAVAVDGGSLAWYPEAREWVVGKKSGKKPEESPEPMFLDPEDPLSWDEKFGNFNLARFGEDELTRPPTKVRPVKRLRSDVLAMMELTSSKEAPERSVRPGKRAHAIYGFGDASKDGFGASVEIEGKGIVWRSGVWNWTMREESSNYREFRNLVEMIEDLVKKGSLAGHELFMFTDNSTAEAAFFKGTSSSEKLFDLVLRLRKIEMRGDLFIHLVHVSGTRMISSGVDGLSRGDQNAGVMSGDSMLSFVPLSQSAAERSPSLIPWVRSWASAKDKNKKVKVLSPTEWCDVHPDGGTYVWVPPPAAASTAIEWLGQSIHKRPGSVHIVLVPRLMTAYWRKRLSKTSDLLFTIPLESRVVWPPKTALGAIAVRPGLKEFSSGCRRCGKLVTTLRGVFCANFWSKRGHWDKCDGVWCGECFISDEQDGFPIRVPINDGGEAVLVNVKDEGRFTCARDGDYLLTRFQCGKCHFRNVQGRDPRFGNGPDELFEKCIRRATLDAFWSREGDTVKGTRGSIRSAIQKADLIAGHKIFPALGPLPLRDIDGMGAAALQLLKTLDPGKTEPLVQYSTAKTMTTALGALWEISVQSKEETVMVRDMLKSYVTTNPCKSQWYEKFLLGMHKRMGDKIKQDEAISIEQMVALMGKFEEDWIKNSKNQNATPSEVREVLFPALFSVLAFCGALRGEEVPLMDVAATREFTASGLEHPVAEKRHGVIALHGRFKNELGERCHLMPVVPITNSGLMPVKWIQRMLDWYEETGVTQGPVFRTGSGMRARQSQFGFSILSRLVKLSEEQPTLFPDKRVDILADYSTRRSFRRGATTRAEILELSEKITDLNNRWRSVEKAKGRRINHSSMRSYYSGVRLMLVTLLKFSQAM